MCVFIKVLFVNFTEGGLDINCRFIIHRMWKDCDAVFWDDFSLLVRTEKYIAKDVQYNLFENLTLNLFSKYFITNGKQKFV